MTDRTYWNDIQDLTAAIGWEAVFELREVRHPPLVCESVPVDWDWPPHAPIPDDALHDPMTCRAHRDEWWPCETSRERHGVTPVAPTVEAVLVIRPRA